MIIVSASAAVLIFLGIMIIGTGLILRDGIGPDAVTSHGKMAWERSRSAILVGACLVFISLVAPQTLIWIKFKKEKNEQIAYPSLLIEGREKTKIGKNPHNNAIQPAEPRPSCRFACAKSRQYPPCLSLRAKALGLAHGLLERYTA